MYIFDMRKGGFFNGIYKRLLDERTYSILCRRLQLELNISDEVLETCQESKMIFLRLDEEKRKFI